MPAWALGLLFAGMCSTMANTYCGQYVMEGLLGVRFKRPWLRVLVTRLVSIGPVFVLVLLETSTVEVISNAVNVLQAFCFPFVLILLLKFTCSELIMGCFVLRLRAKILIYAIGIFLIMANGALIIDAFGVTSPFVYIILVVYLGMLGYLSWRPLAPRTSKSICSTQDSKSAMATPDPEALQK